MGDEANKVGHGLGIKSLEYHTKEVRFCSEDNEGVS